MAEYELDISIDQIVHWLREEISSSAPRVTVVASREYLADEREDFEAAGISRDTDVASLTTVGTLNGSSTGEEASWTINIRIEDVLGPHLPEDESVSDAPEVIDLEGFIQDFVIPDRGTGFATVITETPEAKRRFDKIMEELIRDQHRG